MGGATHLTTTQSLIAFVNFNVINLVFKMLLVLGRPSTSVTEQTIDTRRKIIEDDPHSMYQ